MQWVFPKIQMGRYNDMDYEFDSKVYVGESGGYIWLKVLLIILGAVIGICLLIKLLMGDFNPSDLKSLIFALIIIGCSKLNMGAKPLYENVHGRIHFDKEELYIAYTNIVTSSKRKLCDEKTFIKYADIKEIDLSRDLDCFRIVGDARRERLYKKSGQRVVEQNPDEDGETFIYVSYDDEQDQLKKLLQKNASLIIREMEIQEGE